MIRKRTVSSVKHQMLPFFVASLFTALFAISVLMVYRQAKTATDVMIHQNLTELQKIFEKIDKDCRILRVKHAKNHIDFLTVKHFVGSEVGGLNLAYANRWQGPYLKDNPSMQQQVYVLLKNKQGYFIVPGDGVVLNNGKKIGIDIILNEKTDMNKMLQDKNGLMSSSGALGVKLNILSNRLKDVITYPIDFDGMEY